VLAPVSTKNGELSGALIGTCVAVKATLVMFLRLEISFFTCLLILSHHMTCFHPLPSHDLIT